MWAGFHFTGPALTPSAGNVACQRCMHWWTRGNRFRTDHPVATVEKLHHSKRCKPCDESTGHRKLGERREKAARTYTSRKTRGTGNLVEGPCGEDVWPAPYPRPPRHSRPLHYPLARHTLQHRRLQHFDLGHPVSQSILCIEQRYRSAGVTVSASFQVLSCECLAMASVMNACSTRVAVVAAVPAASGASGLKQAPTSVRFGYGAVAFKRASLVVRAEEKVEPGPGGRGNAPTSPTSPPGLSGTEIPLGVISSTAPLAQGSDKPVGERIAYVCQDCGYVYDEETPFEDVSDEYNCPQCKAPKARFTMANASVEEMLDTTKEDDAVSRGSGEKSGSPPSQS